MESEIHLIKNLNDVLANLKERGKLKPWEYRVTLEGKKYWYDTVAQRSSVEFPYAQSIAKHIKIFRKLLRHQSTMYFKEIQERHPLFNDNPELYGSAMEEANLYMDEFIKRETGRTCAEEIDLANLQEKTTVKSTKNELLDLIFANPYDTKVDEGTLSFRALENPDNISLYTDSDQYIESDRELDDSDLMDKFRYDEEIQLPSSWSPKSRRQKSWARFLHMP